MAARKNNALSSVQAYLLRKWLDADQTKAATTPANRLAEEASATLSFPVTQSNIGAARADLGITPVGYTGARAAASNRNRTAILARSAISLHEHCGLLVPAGLYDLAK
jgi:hypothetical protein